MNKTLELVLRWLVGLMMLVFGANKFLHFIPTPDMEESDLTTFFQGVMASKYLMFLVGMVEMVVGILFLTKKWMPFALVLLAPISVNIVFIHLFLDPANIAMALLVFIVNIALIYAYWGNLKYLFK
jgi:putative oxidoreductase